MGTGFDRNTVIGFILLFAIAIAIIWTGNRGQEAVQKQKQHIQDSTAAAEAKLVNPVKESQDSLKRDSVFRQGEEGSFAGTSKGAEQLTVLENNVVRITFTNRGAQPKSVELKKYKRFDGTPLVLIAPNDQDFNYVVKTGYERDARTSDLFFQGGQVSHEGNNQVLEYTLKDSVGQSIVHKYTLAPDQYMLHLDIQVDGARQLFPGDSMLTRWTFTSRQQESDISYEKSNTTISYLTSDGYDYKTLRSSGDKDLTNMTWFGTKQRFFNNTLISPQSPMYGAEVQWTVPPDSTHDLATTTITTAFRLPQASSFTLPLQWYMGPNDYHILKGYGMRLEENVQMGTGLYAFCKYINRWIVVPVFDFIHSLVGSYGMVILLLTVVIRIVISPLTYSSYLSGAKMRVLRPEINELKKKFKDDQSAFGVEQMKLFRAAGVNPLGGCIPALLQIPIFFSLYAFFASSIDLRGVPFLWAHDLSSYDSILTFHFDIPLYGNHVSLFTLTAIVTSFLIQIWNMSMTPDQNNPMMKYMPYIFPVFLLGVFNRLPAGLDWYYTVSNAITLLIQLVIQKAIIDEKKIHAQLQENKKKPKQQSKWQERLQQMQEMQKQQQAGKTKPTKR